MEHPVLIGRPSDAAITDQLLSPTWTRRSWLFRLALAFTFSGAVLLLVLILATVFTGIGLWGNNIPVAWAFGIANFVWWIGIGHAGTFISAILLLTESPWRTSINRTAEAMTLFAVIQAGMYPILHLGRPWFAYWVVPYPSTLEVWPQFKSALPWDAAAIFTYFTVSFLFWYLGLVPDLATMRDRAPGRIRRAIYGIFALGWRGAAHHWRHYRLSYGLLAGIATPLVLSVHSIVSLDFAITVVPGWHATIFPPYFVAGAIFSGFAMVAMLVIPMRRFYQLHNVITTNHLDNIGKLLLATGLIVAYSYGVEYFFAWYSGDIYEAHTFFGLRPTGPGATIFWLQMFCNVLVPQTLWSRRFRQNPWLLFVVSFFIQIGMWCERFTIIIQSLQQDYLPSAWHYYVPTLVDVGILFGTICFFLFLFLLFIRFVPPIPLSEVKELKAELSHEEHR